MRSRLGWIVRAVHGLVRQRPEETVRCVPSSERLQDLWPDTANAFETRPDLSVLSNASTQVLQELCDDFWASFAPEFEEDGRKSAVVCDPTVCDRALKELAASRLDALAWARSRLRHPETLARASAAWLVGELCCKHPQDCELDLIVGELSALATRPIEEDTKEVQANAVALAVLSRIGGPRILTTLRQILTTPAWEQDDLSWEAARLLGIYLNVPFGESQDPVASARAWVSLNQDG